MTIFPIAEDVAASCRCVTEVTAVFSAFAYLLRQLNASEEVHMKRNMGVVDRVIRGVFAAVVAALYLTNLLSPVASIVLGILAVVFLVTAVAGFCPLYLVFGLSTRRKTVA